jgi:hypothetical protein
MSSFSKIKKVIVLKPGEKFTIPPDSTLLSTTGVLSSTGCPVPIPEDLECYAWIIGEANRTPSPPIYDNLFLTGYILNGVTTSFTSLINLGGNTEVSELLQSPLKDILSDVCITFSTGPTGNAIYLYFKTFPSIASTLILKALSTGDTGDNQLNSFPILFPTLTKTEALAISPNACGCGSN